MKKENREYEKPQMKVYEMMMEKRAMLTVQSGGSTPSGEGTGD